MNRILKRDVLIVLILFVTIGTIDIARRSGWFS